MPKPSLMLPPSVRVCHDLALIAEQRQHSHKPFVSMTFNAVILKQITGGGEQVSNARKNRLTQDSTVQIHNAQLKTIIDDTSLLLMVFSNSFFLIARTVLFSGRVQENERAKALPTFGRWRAVCGRLLPGHLHHRFNVMSSLRRMSYSIGLDSCPVTGHQLKKFELLSAQNLNHLVPAGTARLSRRRKKPMGQSSGGTPLRR